MDLATIGPRDAIKFAIFCAVWVVALGVFTLYFRSFLLSALVLIVITASVYALGNRVEISWTG